MLLIEWNFTIAYFKPKICEFIQRIEKAGRRAILSGGGLGYGQTKTAA
jgi:hypothetical protein